jgi:ketosteroid isomerase-like protein
LSGGAAGYPRVVQERPALVRELFRAYETGDRAVVERLLGDGFTFFSPADPGIDRAAYFERCWPNNEQHVSFDMKRVLEARDEVVVTYEAEKKDGSRFRNTEVFGFDDGRIRQVEVYFGWSL